MKKILLVFSLLFVFGLTACTTGGTMGVAIQGIEIVNEAKTRTVYLEETLQLSAVIYPAEFDQRVKWTSSDDEYEIDIPVFQAPKAAFNFRTVDSFLKKVTANEGVNLESFQVGTKVFHKKFGEGIITKTEPEDNDLKVDIEFEKVGNKRLMAKFANLEIID